MIANVFTKINSRGKKTRTLPINALVNASGISSDGIDDVMSDAGDLQASKGQRMYQPPGLPA
eukprot:2107085-Lingulodinium_polyedra.AAC.1